jgi:hypothetical protein
MAKKKQLAGKKTKLAKLPLTQALVGLTEEASPEGASQSLPLSGPKPLHPTWDELGTGPRDPLTAMLLFLVRELADLQSQLHSNQEPATVNLRTLLPTGVPQPSRLAQALRQARQSLLDVQSLLSTPISPEPVSRR